MSAPIAELDRVILTEDLPAYGLEAGDVGTVVLVHDGTVGYEVEFVALNGETLAVVSVHVRQVRPATSREVHHARPVRVAA